MIINGPRKAYLQGAMNWGGFQGWFFTVYLFILGEAAHDSWVHDAVEQHGEGVDGKAPVSLVLVNHGQNLLIGGLHGLYGVLQRRQGGLDRVVQRAEGRRRDKWKNDVRRQGADGVREECFQGGMWENQSLISGGKSMLH